MQRKSCPYDMAYLLDHPKLIYWKICPCCGYAEDEYGKNLLTKEIKDDLNEGNNRSDRSEDLKSRDSE